jgi:hypothetical protein
MFKVSFKDDYKQVKRLGNTIEVTLTGTMHLPEAWQIIPLKINEWVNWRSYASSISIDFNVANETMIIKVIGKSKKHPDDVDNVVIGERLAESRAKIRLYKFMYRLLDQLCNYYRKLLIGYVVVLPASDIPNSIYAEFLKYRVLYIKESHHLGKLLEEA